MRLTGTCFVIGKRTVVTEVRSTLTQLKKNLQTNQQKPTGVVRNLRQGSLPMMNLHSPHSTVPCALLICVFVPLCVYTCLTVLVWRRVDPCTYSPIPHHWKKREFMPFRTLHSLLYVYSIHSVYTTLRAYTYTSQIAK